MNLTKKLRKELKERKDRLDTDLERPTDRWRIRIIENGLIGISFNEGCAK